MKRHYRISPEGRQAAPSDTEIARYRDPKRLLHNYQKATQLLHRKPLYRDPRAFFALLLIVALAWFLAEVVDRPHPDGGKKDLINDGSPPAHSDP